MARTNQVTKLPGLRALMHDRNMRVVAEMLGIDPSSLSLIVNCKRGVSLAMALKISAYFNVTVEQLVTTSDCRRVA
jgi:plasmid maintenance system antidote protein VapI